MVAALRWEQDQENIPSMSENRRQGSCSTKKTSKNGAVFVAEELQQHKEGGELLMGRVGERKNLLQEEFGEGSYSSCIHHEGLWHISCSGRGFLHLQQPQETKR